MTTGGMIIRLPIAGIRTIGRNTQGVRLIALHPDDLVSDIAKVPASGDDEANGDEANGDEANGDEANGDEGNEDEGNEDEGNEEDEQENLSL
jgi:DNA gyrase subunit A